MKMKSSILKRNLLSSVPILIISIGLVYGLPSRAVEKSEGDRLSAVTQSNSPAKLPSDEASIPLVMDKMDSKPIETNYGLKLMVAMLVIGFIGLASIFGLRRFSKPRGTSPSTQIKVLTQHWLGPKKSLAIIRVSGESILIGITDSSISLIKSLSLLDEEIPEHNANSPFDLTLQGIMEKVKDLKPLA